MGCYEALGRERAEGPGEALGSTRATACGDQCVPPEIRVHSRSFAVFCSVFRRPIYRLPPTAYRLPPTAYRHAALRPELKIEDDLGPSAATQERG